MCAVLAKVANFICQMNNTSKGRFCCFTDHDILGEEGKSEKAGLDPLQATCIPSPGRVLHSTIPLCSLISKGKVCYYWVAADCSPSTSETGIVTQAKLKSA